MGPKIEDLTGRRYGRLVVMYQNGFRYKPSGQRTVLWRCQCDCGNEKDIPSSTLRNGRSQSCGCLNSELASIRATKHGDCKNYKIQRLNQIWRGMKDRCRNKNNPNYKNYGGRGIEVCKEWLESYEAFRDWALANGYRDDLSIDRIDVNGNYEPYNCRWATWEQQANNTRLTIYITAFGQTKTLSDWSRETGIKRGTILDRISKHGWPPERAVTVKPYGWRKEK